MKDALLMEIYENATVLVYPMYPTWFHVGVLVCVVAVILSLVIIYFKWRKEKNEKTIKK